MQAEVAMHNKYIYTHLCTKIAIRSYIEYVYIRK